MSVISTNEKHNFQKELEKFIDVIGVEEDDPLRKTISNSDWSWFDKIELNQRTEDVISEHNKALAERRRRYGCTDIYKK